MSLPDAFGSDRAPAGRSSGAPAAVKRRMVSKSPVIVQVSRLRARGRRYDDQVGDRRHESAGRTLSDA